MPKKESKYGLRIRNYQAGSVYEVMCGVRDFYDYQGAMFTNSLFLDWLRPRLINVTSSGSTKDIIGMNFDYGSRSYEEEMKRIEGKVSEDIIAKCKANKDKYVKKSKEDIRKEFYNDGVTIGDIHYKMLVRTAGKAKKGSCMFINAELYDEAIDFLRMGIKLPEHDAPIVEIGAYSSLVTSTIIDKVKINPKNILIIKDVDSFMDTSVISVETGEDGHCIAKHIENGRCKNTLFDGQALIDISVFPKTADGYVLLRQHFCKMAAFCTNIQQFFRDFYKKDYENAEICDIFGNKHRVKDIKLITTENAMKWTKYPTVTYEYWCKRVNQCGNNFGIVKTSHPSKLGNVQRMSYQMVNALDLDTIDRVIHPTVEYVDLLRSDINAYIDYLRTNANFVNGYDVLIALYEQNHDFQYCDYFKECRRKIISAYFNDVKHGRLRQNADNLTIVGSPYAMLLAAVGEKPFNDPMFDHEDGCIQCWTDRFDDDVYLAEFRNPFNSRNNLGYLHNVKKPEYTRYFNFGRLIIAVNMVGTDFQDRNNGSDQDSDSIYTTDQPDIVAHAKYCYAHYPTIVNSIPKEKQHYDNNMDSFAVIDNTLAHSQRAIGESSNLAQRCLTYTYNTQEPLFEDDVCILSVLA